MPKPLLNENGQQGQQMDPAAQEQLDIFVANGIKMIHNEKISDDLINKVINAPDPVEAIADATLFVVDRIESSAAENGQQLSDDTLTQGSNELMGEIMAMAEQAGLEKLTDEDRHKAYSLAVSKYLDGAIKSGKMSPEDIAAKGQQAKNSPQGAEIMNTVQGMGQPTGGQ